MSERTLELEESEDRFRDFAEIAADWFWELDADLRVTHHTAKASIAGFDGSRVIGLHPWDMPGSSFAEKGEDRIRKLLEGHRPFRQVVRGVVGADGTQRFGRISAIPMFGGDGRFQGYRGTGNDVTAAITAERDLKHHQERIDLALRGGDIAIWDLDARTGQLNFEGNLYEKLGYTAGDEPRSILDWGALVHPDDAPEVESQFAALKEGAIQVSETVVRFRAKNGNWRWILARGRVVERDQQGIAVRIVGSDLDITDRRTSDEHLRRAQKMEAIGQLTGGIAHDFNNILMILDGYARRILDKRDDWPAVEFSVKQIESAAEKAKGLTKSLLSFSRRRELQRNVFDLDAAVLDMTELLKRAVDERYELVFELMADGARVNTDSGELGQALLNLVVNARDAMSLKGGTIIVGTRRVTIDKNHAIAREGLSEGEYIEVYVRDHGCGMSDEVKQRVFEPFFTTKDQGKGTGLGLAMVYGFCHQSDGSVEIDSMVGAGTTITMVLPVTKEGTSAKLVEQLKSSPRGNGEFVLLIEDDEALLDLVKEVVEGLGYTVMAASSGFDALEMTQDSERPVDLILSDIVMPGLSGIELASILSERYPNARVVFMSGYPSRGDRDYGQLSEGACFLQKPVKADELARTLRDQLDWVELEEAV